MYIDAHVHLRDFRQSHKETIRHGLEVARDSGVVAVLDMPNTDPPLTTKDIALARIRRAENANVPEVFYGVYMGLTADVEQVKSAVAATHAIPQIVGMKLYAGHSVGNLGVVRQEDQQHVYETLADEGYEGVLVVHAEKEAAIDSTLWQPKFPITHCFARPEKAEIESVKDQLNLATQTGFRGKLHIAHISSPVAVTLVQSAKADGLDISSGVCPHHLLYDWNQMNGYDDHNGLLWKMNPPLRNPKSRQDLFRLLREGKIDWIETDHAPHTLDDKLQSPYMSGIPGLPWWPFFAEYLRLHDFANAEIERLTFSNARTRFGIDSVDMAHRNIVDRRSDYQFNPYRPLEQELGIPLVESK